ncbi:flavin reductase family protein [Paenibacillus sp. FSL R10-2734]|uniref:flavin reductase family protein n=1 Tax=Paenibacillus sp. FSL R10-2734 TaxID=2954691 RepID=UPI0030DB2517
MRKPTETLDWNTYPGIVAIVSSQLGEIKNIMASGWHTFIGMQPHRYGISLRRETYSYQLIKDSGYFGINFLPAKCSELIQAVGTFSGKDIDKFREFNISYEDGLKANVPILSDAYFAYECKVVDIVNYGDHDWIVGDVLITYKDEELFHENRLPNFSKLSIPLYVGRSSYRVINDQVEVKTHDLYLNKN